MKRKNILKVLLLSVFSIAVLTVSAFAESADSAAAASGTAEGLAMLGAALSTGLACIGAGISVGNASSAAIGALTEDPTTFGKSLIFVVMGEGIALYGMLISILILFS